jgi:hypothetical protein
MGVDVRIKELLPGLRIGFIKNGSGSSLSQKIWYVSKAQTAFYRKTFEISLHKKVFGALKLMFSSQNTIIKNVKKVFQDFFVAFFNINFLQSKLT